MTTDEAMTIIERRKYLAITGLHRKRLIRLMAQSSLRRSPRRTPRCAIYGPDTRHVVRVVWESLDCLCAERLTTQLLATARHLARFGELTLTSALETLLAQISRL